MKRGILGIVLMSFWIFTFVSQALAVLVSVPDAQALPGESLNIFVDVSDATGIAGVDLVLTFDNSLLVAHNAQVTELTSEFTIVSNPQPGKLTIAMASPNPISSGKGHIVNIPFTVSSTAVEGDTSPLHLESVNLWDASNPPNALPVTTQDGKFKVGERGGGNGDGGGGGAGHVQCFIATAAYGSPMAQEVRILSDFRDKYLLTNLPGKALVRFYYRTSPPIAKFISRRPLLKKFVRIGLKPVIKICRLIVKE